jgi:hypothetical protein
VSWPGELAENRVPHRIPLLPGRAFFERGGSDVMNPTSRLKRELHEFPSIACFSILRVYWRRLAAAAPEVRAGGTTRPAR